jgi:hypothetical protein
LQRILALAALAVTLAAAGCGIDKDKGIFMAAGSYGDLAVVVSSDNLQPLANRFLGAFNSTHVFVIKEEPAYKADLYGPEKWDLAKGYKNALLIVALGEGGAGEKAARSIVSKDAWRQLNEGGGGLVQVKDPWSTYQQVVVVAARDRGSLGSVLMRNAAKIRTIFDNSGRERILRRNRYEGLDERLMTAYWDRFGFFMEIPDVFHQNQLEPDGFPGLELMRTGPSQGLTISWEAASGPEAWLADKDVLAAMRARMGRTMHDEEIMPESFTWSEMEIGGQACVKLEGAWTSNRFAGGGPFWCYFIPDPDRGRVFCLDLLVYAPGMDKMDFFRRMEAIAGTFATTRPRP